MRLFFFLALLPLYMVACMDVENEQDIESVQQAYETYLQLALPSSVSDFRGSHHESAIGFMSNAYFQYKALPEYFKLLQGHASFPNESEFNQRFTKLNCLDVSFRQDFSFWTDEKIILKGRDCYEGVYYPTIHQLVYDPATTQVLHFVSSMRG